MYTDIQIDVRAYRILWIFLLADLGFALLAAAAVAAAWHSWLEAADVFCCQYKKKQQPCLGYGCRHLRSFRRRHPGRSRKNSHQGTLSFSFGLSGSMPRVHLFITFATKRHSCSTCSRPKIFTPSAGVLIENQHLGTFLRCRLQTYQHTHTYTLSVSVCIYMY